MVTLGSTRRSLRGLAGIAIRYHEDLVQRLLILCSFWMTAVFAQTHPNFTGTWKQDDSKSSVRPGSTLKYSNVIDHQDPKLAKTTILDYGDRPPKPYTVTYTTDGTPVKSKDGEGDEFTTNVKWAGNELVFEVGEQEKANKLFTRETRSLPKMGRSSPRRFTGPAGGVGIPTRPSC